MGWQVCGVTAEARGNNQPGQVSDRVFFLADCEGAVPGECIDSYVLAILDIL